MDSKGANMGWGLLGPEQGGGMRRTRTLGLGAAVRKFNQLAVPGLGGVWFGKQIFLATLGVRVADRLRSMKSSVKAIEIANAIEALACWCVFDGGQSTRDSRLRGSHKLKGKRQVTFAQLRRPRFYVTQPMRMTTVEPLASLGFVESGSQRFNGFRCAQAGTDLIEVATAEYRPYKTTVERHLCNLAMDEDDAISNTPALCDALSPLVTLSAGARALLRDKLCEGAGQNPDAARRRNALAWVRSIDAKNPVGWRAKPKELGSDHWDDLHLGARFFAVRAAAIDVLDAIEVHMAPQATRKLAAAEAHKFCPLKTLREVAQRFLDERRDPTEDRMATAFCCECIEADSATVIRNLVKRDGRVLRLVGDDVLPGMAFSAHPQSGLSGDGEELDPVTSEVERIPVPSGISGRISNLYLLDLDLQGNLGDFLSPRVGEDAQ